jgi:hypothetical protein
MSAPRVEFRVTGERNFGTIRSSSEVIRFRVARQSGRTILDGDWYSTRWELSRSAWRQIQSAWSAEIVSHPFKKGECGGGRACVIVAIAPEREEFWRQFLHDLLSRPESWLEWDGRGEFVPLKGALETAA